MKGNLQGPSVMSIKLRLSDMTNMCVAGINSECQKSFGNFFLLHMKIVSVFNGAALRPVCFIVCNVHRGMETSGLMSVIMMTTTITPRTILTTTTTTKKQLQQC